MPAHQEAAAGAMDAAAATAATAATGLLLIETATQQHQSQQQQQRVKRCPHLKKGITVSRLSKAAEQLFRPTITDPQHHMKCEVCTTPQRVNSRSTTGVSAAPAHRQIDGESDAASSDVDPSVAFKQKPELHICLSCAKLFCGSETKDHVRAHAVKRNGHSLYMNMTTLDCWCYACSSDIVPDQSTNQLVLEARRAIEKYMLQRAKQPAASVGDNRHVRAASGDITDSNRKGGRAGSSTPQSRIPGLHNLGNTCFFNSVMQCLSSTQMLHRYIPEQMSDSEYVETSIVAESAEPNLRVVASPKTPLTNELFGFLRSIRKEIAQQNAQSISPKRLFAEICRLWLSYSSYRQQDSHELLRRLLDGVKEEQYQRGPNGKVVSFQQPTFVDDVFGGSMASVIVCDTCKHPSFSFEAFLDVSLPITKSHEKKGSMRSFLSAVMKPQSPKRSPQASPREMLAPPNLTITNSDSSAGSDDETSERHHSAGSPGRRFLARGLERLGLSPSHSPAPPERRPVSPHSAMSMMTPASSAPLLNNADDSTAAREPQDSAVSPARSPSPSTALTNYQRLVAMQALLAPLNPSDLSKSEGSDPQSRSGFRAAYNTGSSVTLTLARCLADFMSVEVLDGENGLNCEHCYKLKYGSDDKGTDSQVRAPLLSNLSDSMISAVPSTFPAMHSSFSKSEQYIDKLITEKSSMHLTLGHNAFAASSILPKSSQLSAPSTDDDDDDESDDDDYEDDSSSNAGVLEDPKLAIIVTPSKPSPRPTTAKTKYPPCISKAFKRYLFFRTPSTLVLHLKRFEQVGSSSRVRKVETFIAFDEWLDLAPAMAPAEVVQAQIKREVNSPQTGSGPATPVPALAAPLPPQSGGKYRLFAIVVHQGSIFGGHYIAYTRVPNVPRPTSSLLKTTQGSEEQQTDQDTSPPLEPNASWFYCSDTSVRLATMEEVLKCQAYILFYERVGDSDAK
eukprot:jgi/Hompol1/208/HPOL_005276-RA